MAENVTNKNKPQASNKYSLYAGREEAVNWGQVAVNLTKGLETIRDQRAAAKQKIIDDTNAAMTELSEIADVQSGSMNTLLIDGSDFSKNTLQANMDLVRRGLLDPKDYMLIMQQQKDGYKALSNYAKNYDAKYQEGMARIQDGSASNLEEFFRGTGFSFGNVKNKKLWTDPASGELFLVEMQEDPNNPGKFILPDRASNPDAYSSPSSMVNMIGFQEDSADLNEDVKNIVTNNLAEVVTATISSYNVLSGGKDVKSIEDFRQLFEDVEGAGFENADGSKMTFDDWMTQQAKGVVGNANKAAEYLMNAGMGYSFTMDETEAANDPLKILAKSDGGPPQITLTDEQMKQAENLAKNQINSQLDSVVKINAGLGGQQESASNQGERKENETTAGYISDLNTVLTGDVATAKQTLQGLIETRNVQNKANNQPTIDGFDMTEDYIIFYMSDGNNIRRERGTFDDPDTADDETSKTSISQDIAGIYDVLVPGGQGVKTGLSDQQIFDFIKDQKINIGTEAGEGFGIGESLTEIDNIGATTTKEFTDGSSGTILSIVDDEHGDKISYGPLADTDAEVAETVQKVFTQFQTKQSRINQQRAGITDLSFNDAGGNNITITFKIDGEEQEIKVGDKIAAGGTKKETIAQAISDALNKFNKLAYDEATKKTGSRGARKTFKEWQVDNKRESGESFQDYVKRYYNSYTLN